MHVPGLFHFVPGYDHYVYRPGRETAFVLLLAFLLTFAVVRIYTRLGRRRGWGSGSVGGVGSRVFDVSCDGRMLLQRFDIFGEAGTGPLVKTFTHVEPTTQGKLEIYFTPAINYPSVSAIEVLPE